MVTVTVMVIIITTIIGSRMISTHKASWGDWRTPRIKVINHYNPLYSIHTHTHCHLAAQLRTTASLHYLLNVLFRNSSFSLHPSLGSPAIVHTGACPKSQWAWHANVVIEEPEVERVFQTSSKVQSLIHAAPLENIYILQRMRATMMMTVVVAKLVTATVWLISTIL